jgi:hypothetical protein
VQTLTGDAHSVGAAGAATTTFGLFPPNVNIFVLVSFVAGEESFKNKPREASPFFGTGILGFCSFDVEVTAGTTDESDHEPDLVADG